MIKSHFGNIRNILIDKLKSATYDVYIAVAWITDKKFEEIFISLLRNDVSVSIIIVDDEINKNSNIDWQNLVENGANIYWDDHHHKFCVIDRKIVVTGSFNWTYKASKRENRENIIVIEIEQELIESFSHEFFELKKEARRQNKLPKTFDREIEKEVQIIKEVEKRPIPYLNSGKYYCGSCHKRMRPVKSPQHMVGVAYQSCKSCRIFIDKDGNIV